MEHSGLEGSPAVLAVVVGTVDCSILGCTTVVVGRTVAGADTGIVIEVDTVAAAGHKAPETHYIRG